MDAFDSLFIEGEHDEQDYDDEDTIAEVVTFPATSTSSDDYIDIASLSRELGARCTCAKILFHITHGLNGVNVISCLIMSKS